MPAYPVIANVWRVSLLWSSNLGVKPVNTFHIRATAPATLTQIRTQVNHALDAPASVSAMWDACNSSWSLTQMLLTDLSAANAGQIVSTTNSKAGAQSAGAIPAQAPLVSIRTSVRGPRGRGRLYLPPADEGGVAAGKINTASLTTMGTAWAAFLTALQDGSTVTVAFGVASYQHADFNVATSTIVESLLGTRRPRQDRVRGQ